MSGLKPSQIGQKCSPLKDVFTFICGDGAACVQEDNINDGICKCLPNYILSEGRCLYNDNNGHNDNGSSIPNPLPQPLNYNNGYSAALGAIISIIVLFALAASVFFGTKYRLFTKIRNRLPHTNSFWWSRRGNNIIIVNDNVSMANRDDDDDDLLI